jgi:hypothetical protein
MVLASIGTVPRGALIVFVSCGLLAAAVNTSDVLSVLVEMEVRAGQH